MFLMMPRFWWTKLDQRDRLCGQIAAISPDRKGNDCDIEGMKRLYEQGGSQLRTYLEKLDLQFWKRLENKDHIFHKIAPGVVDRYIAAKNLPEAA